MRCNSWLNRLGLLRGYWAILPALQAGLAIASEGGAAPAGGHGAEAAAHGGEPNVLGGDLGNVFWTLAIFIVLLVVLRLTAWNPILDALRKREKFIEDSLTSARREREEAERLLKDYTLRIEKAQHEATAIVEEGRKDAEAVRRKIHEESRKEADEMIARAKREIATARDDAVKALYERTLDLASDVAGKVVGRALSNEDHRGLLDESIREIAALKK